MGRLAVSRKGERERERERERGERERRRDGSGDQALLTQNPAATSLRTPATGRFKTQLAPVKPSMEPV